MAGDATSRDDLVPANADPDERTKAKPSSPVPVTTAPRDGRHDGRRPNRPPLRIVSNDVAPQHSGADSRAWTAHAMRFLEAERANAPETPLMRIPCPELPGINFVLKDESRHPTGSLKHRLARALYMHGIASGDIAPETVIVEASSGSTAISEAWFAKRLGLRFVAVVPALTAPAKLAAIRAEGAELILAKPGTDLGRMGAEIAENMGGYYMDQFDRAADVTDWRGDNIARALIGQVEAVGLGTPAWIVAGVGTGGTAATIGRYLRTRPELSRAKLCVVDPEGSAYFQMFATGDREANGCSTGVVEGLGRARVSASFLPEVIDHMVAVSDEGSVSGAHWLARRIGRKFGPSTGTNVIGALILGQAMARRGETGTIALLGCDSGERYRDTIYNDTYLRAQGIADGGWKHLLTRLGEGAFPAAY